MLQLRALHAVTGSQTPETASPQLFSNDQLSQSQQNGPDLSKFEPPAAAAV